MVVYLLQICNIYDSRLPTLKTYIVPYSTLGNKVELPKKYPLKKRRNRVKHAFEAAPRYYIPKVCPIVIFVVVVLVLVRIVRAMDISIMHLGHTRRFFNRFLTRV